MNNDLVIVESKTVNNESIAITINVAEVAQGGRIDRREISRSFVFQDFQSIIPLRLAKTLVKKYPEEYRIVASAEENPSDAVLHAIKRSKEDAKGYFCKECGEEAKSKSGLTSHMRNKHPEKFTSKKKSRKQKSSKKTQEVKQEEVTQEPENKE